MNGEEKTTVRPLVVGIAGGSGSGKSSLIEEMRETFGEYIALLTHDNYYKAHDDLTFEERERLNYDEPAAFDNALFAEHLTRLRNGESVECPVYDYVEHNRKRETVLLEARPVLLVDGILIFAEDRIADLFDLRVFVDTDADRRFIRRLERDTVERGRSVESVIQQYLDTVKPMHEKYVEPSKQVAHIVVPENFRNPVGLEVLKSYLLTHLKKNGFIEDMEKPYGKKHHYRD